MANFFWQDFTGSGFSAESAISVEHSLLAYFRDRHLRQLLSVRWVQKDQIKRFGWKILQGPKSIFGDNLSLFGQLATFQVFANDPCRGRSIVYQAGGFRAAA